MSPEPQTFDQWERQQEANTEEPDYTGPESFGELAVEQWVVNGD